VGCSPFDKAVATFFSQEPSLPWGVTISEGKGDHGSYCVDEPQNKGTSNMSETATTDFEVWLGANNLEEEGNLEVIYNLYMAVLKGETIGKWDVTTKDDKTFVKGAGLTLQLLSDMARNAFLKRVERLNDDPDMSMEAWYVSKKEMAKND
jgi:hypothetical protein